MKLLTAICFQGSKLVSEVARIEVGLQLLSMKSVIRYATAIGAHPFLQLVPSARETRTDR